MKKKRSITYRGELMSNDMWEKSEVVRLLKGAPGTQYQESDDANKAIIRDWIKSLLQKDTVTITFVKADGSLRDMQCTLNWDAIPMDKHPGQPSIDGLVREGKERKQPDEHSLRVFDVEKQEWRSFRFDRLQKVSATLNFN
jgi:hypothetical protein